MGSRTTVQRPAPIAAASILCTLLACGEAEAPAPPSPAPARSAADTRAASAAPVDHDSVQAEAARAAEALGLVSADELRFRIDLAVPPGSSDPFDRIRARQAILARELVLWYLARRQVGPEASETRLREAMRTGRPVLEAQGRDYLDRHYPKALDHYRSQGGRAAGGATGIP